MFSKFSLFAKQARFPARKIVAEWQFQPKSSQESLESSVLRSPCWQILHCEPPFQCCLFVWVSVVTLRIDAVFQKQQHYQEGSVCLSLFLFWMLDIFDMLLLLNGAPKPNSLDCWFPLWWRSVCWAAAFLRILLLMKKLHQLGFISLKAAAKILPIVCSATIYTITQLISYLVTN